MVNACLYLQKTGCQWRFLPKEFGPWQTVRSWHDRFRADGVWTDATALLTRAVRRRRGHAAEPATAILDSQSNRYRRLTRNREQSPTAAEDAVAIANCHRVLRAYTRDT